MPLSMLRAIFFDMGGTLDGDGHWLDRFVQLYAAQGLDLSRETIRRGFDHAERRAASDTAIVDADMATLVRRHLAWQFELHGLDDAERFERIVDGFLTPLRRSARRNATLLATLRDRGLALGVVSNACGNARALCDDLGYSPSLSVVIDSRVVGIAKPDPGIYRLALERTAVEPAAAMMVGDSYERDIVPASRLGMQTAWLVHGEPPASRGVADRCISALDEITAWVPTAERASA